VKISALQFFFLAISISFASAQGDLAVGQIHALKFVDLDGNAHSTTDGHMTVIVLTTRDGLSKAQMVGDRVPSYCLGNPAFRMITVVKFGPHNAAMRNFMAMMARRRLDAEGGRLQRRYEIRNIKRVARNDVFAVADFDGSVVAKLGSGSADFRVLVFGRTGELLKQWDEVPSAADLAAVLKL
jgi:hypothetical protein